MSPKAAKFVHVPVSDKKPEGPFVPYLRLNTETGYYYVRRYKAGLGELFVSTGEKSKDRARTRADELMADWIGGRRIAKRVRVEEFRHELFEHLKKLHERKDDHGRPLRRLRTHQKDKTYLLDKRWHGKNIRATIPLHFGEMFVDQIDEAFWEDWIDTRGRELGRKLGDIAKYLSLMLDYAFKRKLIVRKPEIRDPDKHVKKALIYEDRDLVTFIKAAESDLQDLLIIAGENPIRPHEVRELEKSFCHATRPDAVVVKLPPWFTKTETGREFQLSPQASHIVAVRCMLGDSKYLFPAPKNPKKPLSDVQLSRMWRRMLAKVNVDREKQGLPPFPIGRNGGIKFHWTRHSAYSKLLLDAREAPAAVSEFGGTSIATLQKNYLRSNAVRTRTVGQALRLKLGEGES